MRAGGGDGSGKNVKGRKSIKLWWEGKVTRKGAVAKEKHYRKG
jgi:hypothetical protein